ncbi:hypothetical protein C5F52_15855 [Limnohabitans sp. TS-CS-82]|nr:hypothetical protein C5F52_15855 [Limnohabitans sp. TS-CS-82]
MKKWILMLALPLALSACMATRPKLNLNDPQAVSSAIAVTRDDFKKLTRYTGPDAAEDIRETLLIRAWKHDKDNQVTFQIYVSDFYKGGWRHYNQAHDSNGNSLEVNVISRDVITCSGGTCAYQEDLGLQVTRDYLERNKDSGLFFKISGKGGEETFRISGAYIKAVLSVVK